MKLLSIILLTGMTLFILLVLAHSYHCYKATLRTRWKALKAKYKRLGLPPIGTMFLFVAALMLYVIGTAIF